MRTLPLLALALLPAAAGCGTCGTSTGWRFEVLSPPVIMSPSMVASGPAPLGSVGLGTIEHRQSQAVQLVQDAPCVTQTPIRPMAPAYPDCTLQDACQRIAALEAQIRAQQRRESLPMPRPMNDPEKKTGE